MGGLVGGFLAGLITGGDYTTGINIRTIVVAVIGAVILVVGYNLIQAAPLRRNFRLTAWPRVVARSAIPVRP